MQARVAKNTSPTQLRSIVDSIMQDVRKHYGDDKLPVSVTFKWKNGGKPTYTLPTTTMPEFNPTYTVLKVKDERFAKAPIVIECAYCQTTMWANSDNALVSNDAMERIVCRTCAGPDAEIVNVKA